MKADSPVNGPPMNKPPMNEPPVNGPPVNEPAEFPSIPIDSQVINHLMVQKAIIHEEGVVEGQRIEEYLKMVKQLKTEEHLAFDNPMDKSVAVIFELVLENHIDPWNIDLAAFARVFVSRIRKDRDMDLVIVGEIIYMAFSILKLQSEYLVVHAEELSAEEQYDDEFDYMEEFEDFWEKEEDNLFDHIVESSPKAPIEEKVRRKGSRKVTLFELVEAFENAFKEAKKHVEHEKDLKKARKKRKQLALKARKDVNKETHKENIKEDTKEIFRRIVESRKKRLRFGEITGQDTRDRIKTFVSLLFLAFERKINIRQVNFPHGDILIENIWKGPRTAEVGETGDSPMGDARHGEREAKVEKIKEEPKVVPAQDVMTEGGEAEKAVAE